jgi:hypothetical protein
LIKLKTQTLNARNAEAIKALVKGIGNQVAADMKILITDAMNANTSGG